jgi:hypothetical protein
LFAAVNTSTTNGLPSIWLTNALIERRDSLACAASPKQRETARQSHDADLILARLFTSIGACLLAIG